MSLGSYISTSSRIQTLRSVANEATQLQRNVGHPCSLRRLTSLPGRTASNAPFISSVATVAVSPFVKAASTSCVRQVVRSTLDRLGSAPNCCRESTSYLMAIHDIRLAISLSSPFPSTESSAIGLYDLGELISALFGLPIIARIATWKHFG